MSLARPHDLPLGPVTRRQFRGGRRHPERTLQLCPDACGHWMLHVQAAWGPEWNSEGRLFLQAGCLAWLQSTRQIPASTRLPGPVSPTTRGSGLLLGACNAGPRGQARPSLGPAGRWTSRDERPQGNRAPQGAPGMRSGTLGPTSLHSCSVSRGLTPHPHDGQRPCHSKDRTH